MLSLKWAGGYFVQIFFLISANGFLSTGAAHATAYYVDPIGSDSNNGTSETMPFQTFSKGVNALRHPGDTLFVKNGTYNISFVSLRYGGTQSQPIRVMAYPGHAPIVRFPIVKTSALTYPQMEIKAISGRNQPIEWVVIEGLRFEYGYWPLHVYSCTHCVFRRNTFFEPYGTPILGSGLDSHIDRNVMIRAGTGIHNAHGLYLQGSRWIVTNNLIYGQTGYGIQLNGTLPFDPKANPSKDYSNTHDVIVANNVLAYSMNSAGMVIWGPRVANLRVENNIFYENWSTGPNSFPNGINWVACCSTGVQIRNNLFFATGSGGTMMSYGQAIEGVNFVQSGNIINTSAPDFVNAPAALPASPNFKLTLQSPAIDKGLSTSPTKVDFDGTPRPLGLSYDIGAYEYSFGQDTRVPAAPILQVR